MSIQETNASQQNVILPTNYSKYVESIFTQIFGILDSMLSYFVPAWRQSSHSGLRGEPDRVFINLQDMMYDRSSHHGDIAMQLSFLTQPVFEAVKTSFFKRLDLQQIRYSPLTNLDANSFVNTYLRDPAMFQTFQQSVKADHYIQQ